MFIKQVSQGSGDEAGIIEGDENIGMDGFGIDQNHLFVHSEDGAIGGDSSPFDMIGVDMHSVVDEVIQFLCSLLLSSRCLFGGVVDFGIVDSFIFVTFFIFDASDGGFDILTATFFGDVQGGHFIAFGDSFDSGGGVDPDVVGMDHVDSD
jgi:hypothetical protein